MNILRTKHVFVGAGLIAGIGLWAGSGLAFDGKTDADALGAPVTADDLSDERAGSFLIGVGSNDASQNLEIDGDFTNNAGDVILGSNNRSFASAYAINTGAGANVLAQNVVIINLTTTD